MSQGSSDTVSRALQRCPVLFLADELLHFKAPRHFQFKYNLVALPVETLMARIEISYTIRMERRSSGNAPAS
jgi:hypothetical protein